MRDDERRIVLSLRREAERAPSVEGPPFGLIRRVKRRRAGRAGMFTVSIGIVVGVAAVALVALSPLGDRSPSRTSVGPVRKNGVTLLRHDLAPEDIPSPGVAQGQVGLLNGCVAIGVVGVDQAEFEASASYLVFPSGYELRQVDATIEVVDASGDPVARIGEGLRIDAHPYELPFAEQHAEIPEACRQPGLVKPNWVFVRGNDSLP